MNYSDELTTFAVVMGLLLGMLLVFVGIGYLSGTVVRSPEYIAERAAERAVEIVSVAEQFPQLSEKQCQQIANGDVWLGMTDEMARKSWGRTSVVNTSVNQWRTREQWVYRTDYSAKYLYFENGILASYSF